MLFSLKKIIYLGWAGTLLLHESCPAMVSRGYSVAVCGLLIAVASLGEEHGLSSCGEGFSCL